MQSAVSTEHANATPVRNGGRLRLDFDPRLFTHLHFDRHFVRQQIAQVAIASYSSSFNCCSSSIVDVLHQHTCPVHALVHRFDRVQIATADAVAVEADLEIVPAVAAEIVLVAMTAVAIEIEIVIEGHTARAAALLFEVMIAAVSAREIVRLDPGGRARPVQSEARLAVRYLKAMETVHRRAMEQLWTPAVPVHSRIYALAKLTCRSERQWFQQSDLNRTA